MHSIGEVLGTAVTEYGVALGIDGFDGLVGGNISGTSDLAPLDEQAAMLHELFPEMKGLVATAMLPFGYPAETAHPSRLHTDRMPLDEMVIRL